MAINVTVARLNTLVTANATQFTKELDRASAVAKSRGMSINGALGNVGVGLSIAGVVAYGKSVLDLAGNIQDLALQANLTPRGLQTIANVAMDSGVSMEDVARASEKMRSKLQDAKANGADSLNASLRKIGLTAQGLSALDTDTKWEVIARALENARDRQLAMNIASDLFGEKIGPRLRETLAIIAKGMNKAAQSANGLTISNDQLAKLDAMGDRFGKIGKMFKILGANAMTGSAFQKDWEALKAGFGFETGGSVLPDTELDRKAAAATRAAQRKQMFDAEQKAYEKDFKDYWQKVNAIEDRYKKERAIKMADPMYQFEQKKKRDEFRSNVAEMYSAQFPELAGFLADMQKAPSFNQQPNTPTDSFSRIGLMSSLPPTTRVDGEQKKQTEHLKNIQDILKKINEALKDGRVKPAAAFSN